MSYYSHPERLLIDHLKEVKDIGIGKLPIEFRDAFEIASLSHDFGKYTRYFQDYLNTKEKNELANHGFISAIFGAYLSFNRFGEESYLPLLIYNSILHHHGNVDNLSLNLPNKFNNTKKTDYNFNLLNKIEIFGKQIIDIEANKNIIAEDMKVLGLDKEFFKFIEDNMIHTILLRLKKLESKNSRQLNDNIYFDHQAIYSALIYADKISASRVKYDEPLYGGFDILNQIKNNNLTDKVKEINKIRSEIFTKVQQTIEVKNQESNIFFITAPTGTGKTYAGFYAALKLREKLNLKGKIIYALPFTSIIEQNYDAITKIYEGLDDYEKNKGRYIIKHHNLAKTDYESEYQNYTKTQSELLIENWESGVIITTFVQLFETLVGNRNRMLKKYINFYDSVILLDEVQSIDIKYYKLVEFALEKICKLTNSKIIMMTATKPMILTEGVELLENHKDYYKFFNRTKLVPKLDKISINEFVDEFSEDIEDRSYLIVSNTINQSLEIFDKLSYLDREIYYLSTNILPIHRRQILSEISDKLKNKEKIILVSTQVVEAGVDLDFDEVIRDIGPLDSIIQCAGRCNRNGNKDIGDVKIYRMIKDNGHTYASNVYGSSIINITVELLENKDYILEKDFLDLIDEYFKQVLENKSQAESEEFIKAIKTLDFSEGDSSISKFSLIKDNPMYQDVIFIYDEIAEKAFEDYKRIIKIKDFEEKREMYLEIGQLLKNYTLSIPFKYCKAFTEESGILILPNIGIEQYYDEKTGFKRDNNDETMIF